jgi:ABC-2 type transport system ATP-binding protein
MSTAIQISQLSKMYDHNIVLKKLDLEIEEGEIFGFLGHNGAGKTTTLNILTTLLKPSAGQAYVGGHHVVKQANNAREVLGYVPENVKLYGRLSAKENLAFFAKLSGIRRPENEIKHTLDFLECANLADQAVGTMSKGQRQRIGLAQAILHRPKILFLDEPTSGLDPLGIKNLRDLIIKLNVERGTTIFMNTHLISEVAKTCSSIAVLSHGSLVYRDSLTGTLNKFKNESELEALYLSVTPHQQPVLASMER